MNRKYLLSRIAQDCIPTVFSLLMSGLYGVMDGLFVGRAVGDAGLAAINIAWPIAAVITAVGIGIGSGGSVLYSNSNGKGEQERGEVVYHQTIILLFAAAMVLLIVLGFTYPAILSALGAKGDVYQKAVEYIQIIIFGAVFQVMGTGFIPMLRNRNLAFQAMVSMAAGMGVNGVLNYLLLFVVKIGIRGAAVGTIAAQFVVLVISSYLIYGRQKVHLKVVWQHKMIGEILKIGISAFGLSLAPSIVLLFTNLQCLKYGGDAAVACYAVISYIVFPVQSMLMGIGDGTQPLMSFYSGAKKNGRTSFREKNRIDCSCRNGCCFLCHRDFSIKIYSGCFWNADGLPGLFWNRDGSQCGFIFVHRTGKVPYFLFECDTSGEKSNAAYLW